jgi:uncharacterized protein YkwD
MVLCSVAIWHADDMAERNYLAELDPDGRGLRDRLLAVGLSATSYQENVQGKHPYDGVKHLAPAGFSEL